MYHTKSKLMVNGGEAQTFNQEHSRITNLVLQNENVNQLDKDLINVLVEGLRSLVIEKPPAKSNRTSNSNKDVSVTDEQSQGLVNLSEQEKENIEDPLPCPSCAEPVTLHGIFATNVKTGSIIIAKP